MTRIAAPGRHTYGQILKSSALIGGSSVINVAISVVRVKAMAMLLGPAGVGLMGLYVAILDVTQSVAGMGLNTSGVRQIAEAVGSGEAPRVAQTAVVLRRASIVLGCIGGAVLVALSGPISRWTFGSDAFAMPVALLSLGVLFQLVSNGQSAVIQGTRRIGDLARVSVFAALAGAVVTLALIYVFRERGVVPSLVISAAITMIFSSWFCRKIQLPSVLLTTSETRRQAATLLSLGSAFMATAILTSGAAYVIRTMVGNHSGLAAAGLYHSAWTLGGLYVGFILQGMGTDFYPRLTASANNPRECNRLVNEQAHMSLLLATPGVIATLTFAPLVIALFYDTTFAGAVEPLRWVCLGMALRVVAWPMGYIILAKGERGILFWTEVAAAIVHVGLAFALIDRFGIAGATMAFFGLYVWHGILIYVLVRRLTGFRWSAANRRNALVLLPLIAVVFTCLLAFPVWVGTAVGVTALVFSSVYSLREICKLISLSRVPRAVRDALAWCRISPPVAVADVAPSEL